VGSTSNFATGTLTDGHATIKLPKLGSGTGTYSLDARVTDLAGNQGTSATVTLSVTASSNAWTASGQFLTVDPVDGMAFQQLGDLQLTHPIDLDTSPGASASGNAAFVYNSDWTAKPVIQASMPTDNTATAAPTSMTATLTWNGTAQTGVTFSSDGQTVPGDVLTVALQVGPPVTATGRYPWSVQLSAGGHTSTASGVAYVAVPGTNFGTGWLFGPVDQLVSIASDANGPAGMLRIYGTGGERFYTQGTGATYTLASDPGTLVKNGDNTYTYSLPDGERWNFNSSGYETSQVSADGLATLSYRYDGSNRLSGMTAIDGTLSTFSYGTNVVTITTSNNRVTTLTLSGGALASIKNPDGGTDSFTGGPITNETFGMLQNNWGYSSGMLGTITQGSSSSPSVSYPTPVAAQGLGASSKWTSVAAQATLKDPNNHVTSWQLDAQGRLLQQTAADGGITQYTRDGTTTWVTKVTDPLNRVTTLTRDSSGYVTQATLPDGNTRNYAYQSAFHALTTMTDERNNTTTFGYDSGGHQIRVTNALGQASSSGYDATTGLLTASTDALGHTTSYAYDSKRRQTTVTDALNNVTSYSYDANGNPLTTTDARGDVTTTNYDVMGRETSVIDALGDITTMTYDVSGLSLTNTDPLNRQALGGPGHSAFGGGLYTTGNGITRIGATRPTAAPSTTWPSAISSPAADPPRPDSVSSTASWPTASAAATWPPSSTTAIAPTTPRSTAAPTWSRPPTPWALRPLPVS
jgi:YD repeat-containing protein